MDSTPFQHYILRNQSYNPFTRENIPGDLEGDLETTWADYVSKMMRHADDSLPGDVPSMTGQPFPVPLGNPMSPLYPFDSKGAPGGSGLGNNPRTLPQAQLYKGIPVFDDSRPVRPNRMKTPLLPLTPKPQYD